jgi:hypothetical protein
VVFVPSEQAMAASKRTEQPTLEPNRFIVILPSRLVEDRSRCITKFLTRSALSSKPPIPYSGYSRATTVARLVRQSGMGPRMASVGARSSTL